MNEPTKWISIALFSSLSPPLPRSLAPSRSGFVLADWNFKSTHFKTLCTFLSVSPFSLLYLSHFCFLISFAASFSHFPSVQTPVIPFTSSFLLKIVSFCSFSFEVYWFLFEGDRKKKHNKTQSRVFSVNCVIHKPRLFPIKAIFSTSRPPKLLHSG